MFNTMKEIKDLADCIPGYTAVYRIGDTVERIYNSDNLPDLLGYSKEEFAQWHGNPLGFVYQEDRENVEKKLHRAIQNHEKLELSYRFLPKSGALKWARLHGNYLGEMEGKAIYLASIYDVSDEWKLRDSILDASDRGVVVFDRESKTVLYGNDKFFAFAGTTKEACLGQPCYKVVCGAGVYDKNSCICFHAIGRTEPLATHNTVTDSYYEISASETQWGEHPAIIFYMADITAATKKDKEIAEKNAKLQKIQEEAIRNYQKQLELITDGSSDVLSTCRFNLTKNLCIPGTCGTKYMRELQGEGTAEGYFRLGLAHMDDADVQSMQNYPSVKSLLAAFAGGTETVAGDGYYNAEDGTALYVRTTVRMARNPVTQDVEAVLYTRDLTGTKLRNDIMKCLMEQQYESISIINLQNRKVSVFSYMYDEKAGTQYDGEDYDICRTFFTTTYVAPDDRAEYRKNSELAHIVEKLEAQGSYSFMFHLCPEPGKTLLKIIEYFYVDDRRRTVIGATRDVTEITRQQKKNMDDLKEALFRADKATEAKSAFFSNISHDMRTPLNGILGFAGLGREATTLEAARDSFAKIESSGRFLLKLINDTLDISKIESGQMKLNPGTVSLDELLSETVNAVEETAREKKIALEVERPAENNHDVLVDKLRLEQMLTNLLGNAIKFTRPGGKVRFAVRELPAPEAGCNYQITIEDNGCGMKKEFIPHAFEAYSQGESGSAAKAQGTGLGLAIVKQIVTLMKGTITLESEEGKGTRYEILLPLEAVRPQALKQTAAEPRAIHLAGKRVLLCEDHPINRELACRLLEREGVKITCAENGKIGVQLFTESAPGAYDAILMDIRMPEMNGLEAAEAIRKLDRPDARAIPIIAMTANAYESDKKAALRFGMNAHLAKPIDPKALYRTLDDYINGGKAQAEIAAGPWKPKVIVADDQEVNVAVIRAAIEGEYTVFEARDGNEAMRILAREDGIAAVITDIQMPKMDGVALIKSIRADHAYDHIAILANTQYGDPSQQATLLAMGADDFIFKPTVPPIALVRLGHIIGKHRQEP